MERKIGEKFTIGDKTYVVEVHNICADCAFEASGYNCFSSHIRDKIGHCIKEEREDSKSVIFKEVKQNNTNMKPFNLEEAKAGKPVCTRDGHEVRILCYDAKGGDDTRIVALVDINGVETPMSYYKDGKVFRDTESDADLIMVTEKKQGWINIYRDRIYDTCEAAKKAIYPDAGYIKTCLIEWEE